MPISVCVFVSTRVHWEQGTRLTRITTTISRGAVPHDVLRYRGTCHVLLGSLRSFPELGT